MTVRGAVCGAGLLLGLTCVGIGVFQAPPPGPNAGAVPAAVVDSAAVRRPSATAIARTGIPHRLRLPSIGVDAQVVAVTVRDGWLDVPPDPALVGWWRDGTAPGATAGSVVIDGHVDSWANGPGALFRLAELAVGDQVVLDTSGGEFRYVVRAVRSYPKASLPVEVFDRTGQPRAVLISCGGRFDRQIRRYSDNVVVYAVPEPA